MGIQDTNFTNPCEFRDRIITGRIIGESSATFGCYKGIFIAGRKGRESQRPEQFGQAPENSSVRELSDPKCQRR
jgi:hypothetical protein